MPLLRRLLPVVSGLLAFVPAPLGRADRAPQRLRFIAVGDTGRGNEGQRKVAGAMAELCRKRGCDFVLLLGDNIYDSGCGSPDDPQFQSKFERPYAALSVPFYVALGNHDYGGGGLGNDKARPEHEIAYTQRSKKWRLPARSYHFSSGPAELVALDTNAILWGFSAPGTRETASWLAQSTRPWKIAFGHHPYLSNGLHGDAGRYDGMPDHPIASGTTVKAALEAEVCDKADLYLAGHDHNRQWLTERCGKTELVVSGAGSGASALVGSHATRFQSTNLGFLYIVADEQTLRAEFIDADGRVDFTRTLTRTPALVGGN